MIRAGPIRCAGFSPRSPALVDSVENQRPVTFLFIAGGLAAGVFVRSAARFLLPVAGLEDPLLLGVVALSAVLGVVGGAATFFALMRSERASAFTDSVVSELRVVHWPEREETVNNTGIVVGATVFFSALLAGYDFFWAKLTEFVLYRA